MDKNPRTLSRRDALGMVVASLVAGGSAPALAAQDGVDRQELAQLGSLGEPVLFEFDEGGIGLLPTLPDRPDLRELRLAPTGRGAAVRVTAVVLEHVARLRAPLAAGGTARASDTSRLLVTCVLGGDWDAFGEQQGTRAFDWEVGLLDGEGRPGWVSRSRSHCAPPQWAGDRGGGIMIETVDVGRIGPYLDVRPPLRGYLAARVVPPAAG